MEERYQDIRNEVMSIIDNIDKLNLDTKEFLIKIVKKIYIKDDYSVRFEYTFDE